MMAKFFCAVSVLLVYSTLLLVPLSCGFSPVLPVAGNKFSRQQISFPDLTCVHSSNLKESEAFEPVITDPSSLEKSGSATTPGAKSSKKGKRRYKNKKGKMKDSSTKLSKEGKNIEIRAGKKGKSKQGLKRKNTGKHTRKGKTSKTRRPLTELKLGAEIDGNVVEIKPYGAFIQTKYAMGNQGWALLHISQISGERIKEVGDVLRIGQKIRPRVISIDYEKEEVGVSMRSSRSSRKSLKDVEVGDEMEGRVKSITAYGVFVDVGYTSDALIHISRISLDKIDNITDYLNVGDKVCLHIIQANAKMKAMAGSLLPESADDYLDRKMKYRSSVERKKKE